jgi:hypothetical protein
VQHNTADSTGWRNYIPGATSKTYVPTADDDGGIIQVLVTGWKDGYDPLEVGRFGVHNPKVDVHKALVVTPVISGDVGTAKTLTAKVWLSGAKLTYQWKRNGTIVPGATGRTYKTGLSDLGKRITVKVTGTLAGFRTASATSAPTPPVTQQPTQYSKIPTFSWPASGNHPVVGQTIRMTGRGAWTAGAKLTFQWTRNGVPIKGATGSSYKATSSDVGKRLTVIVTGQAPNHSKVAYEDSGMPVLAR